MSSFFPTRDHAGDAWFRLGRIEMTTTNVAVLVGAVSMLVTLFVPGLGAALAYVPSQLLLGQVWSPFTWPLANGFDLWGVLSLFMLWYFGNDLERMVGRRSMLWLLVGIWGSLTLTTTLLGLLATDSMLAGLRMIQFSVLLVWIAEYPQRRFLFNIPAWIFGAVLVALQVLPLLAAGQFGSLLSFLLSLVLIAVVARRVGLLGELAWIPGRGRPRASRPAPAPKPSRAQQRQTRRRVSDDERMDELLGKISAQGIHALSKSERAELEKLRERRRR